VQILAIESISQSHVGSDINDCVDFMERLRAKPWAKGSTIILIVESNYGGAPRAAEFLRKLDIPKFAPTRAMSEDIEGHARPGIWLTHDYKERMVQFTNTELYNNRITFHTDILTKTCDDPAKTLVDQLKQFKRIFCKEPTAHSAGRLEPKLPFKYSGKGNGKKDDVCMAFLEAIFFYDRWMLDTHYDARASDMTIGCTDYDLKFDGKGFDLQNLRWERRQKT
jgi:hypothetical protein